MYIEENYTEYDHSIGAYSKLSTRSHCQLDYTYKAKDTCSGRIFCYKIQPLQEHPC